MEIIEACLKWPNDILFVKKLRLELWKCIIVMFQLKVAPYSYDVSVQVLFEGLLFLFRESCGVET